MCVNSSAVCVQGCAHGPKKGKHIGIFLNLCELQFMVKKRIKEKGYISITGRRAGRPVEASRYADSISSILLKIKKKKNNNKQLIKSSQKNNWGKFFQPQKIIRFFGNERLKLWQKKRKKANNIFSGSCIYLDSKWIVPRCCGPG